MVLNDDPSPDGAGVEGKNPLQDNADSSATASGGPKVSDGRGFKTFVVYPPSTISITAFKGWDQYHLAKLPEKTVVPDSGAKTLLNRLGERTSPAQTGGKTTTVLPTRELNPSGRV